MFYLQNLYNMVSLGSYLRSWDQKSSFFSIYSPKSCASQFRIHRRGMSKWEIKQGVCVFLLQIRTIFIKPGDILLWQAGSTWYRPPKIDECICGNATVPRENKPHFIQSQTVQCINVWFRHVPPISMGTWTSSYLYSSALCFFVLSTCEKSLILFWKKANFVLNVCAIFNVWSRLFIEYTKNNCLINIE